MTDALFISALVSSLRIKVDNVHPRAGCFRGAQPLAFSLACHLH